MLNANIICVHLAGAYTSHMRPPPAPKINVDCGTELSKTCCYPATSNIEWWGEGEGEERVAEFKAIKSKNGRFVHSCHNEFFYDCRSQG